jgi:hypothetical protein
MFMGAQFFLEILDHLLWTSETLRKRLACSGKVKP